MKNRTSSVFRQLVAGFILSLGVAQAASAGIIITRLDNIPGSAPPPPADSRAVSFTTPESFRGPSTTVTGTIGPSSERYLVDFTSNELLEAAPVSAVDDGINRIDIRVRDSAFTSLYLNFRKATESNNPSRFGDITVSGFGGEVEDFTLELRNGNNYVLVEATDGTLLKDLLFITPFDSVRDVRAVRFSGLQDAPVPEPATLLSLGIGMAGMVAVGRRKRPGKTAACRAAHSISA